MGDTTNEPPEQAPTVKSSCSAALAEVPTIELWRALRSRLDVDTAAAVFDAAATRA
jgi:hypothetical protein